MAAVSTPVVRTRADEIADAVSALDAAFCEMRNWYAHLEAMRTHPADADAIAWQARRSGRIVAALIADAEERAREAGYGESLRSVS